MTPRQIEAFQQYGDVLFIDVTSSTNVFGTPLVHLVIFNANKQARHIASAVTLRETTEDIAWILSCLTEATGCFPRVTIRLRLLCLIR